MEKTLQCVTRSKKKKQEENEPFPMITHDLKMEILFKTPAKSIAKLNFVSNLFSSLVRSKSFTNAYMARSLSHPRLLLRANRDGLHFFHSSPQENPSYDPNERVNIMELDYSFSPPVRGLICGRVGFNVLVGNPSTGQFITLPRVTREGVGMVLCFLGYEPVNNVYKVLRLTLNQEERGGLVSDDKFEVLTLGGSDKHRRMVECKHRHFPYSYQTSGLCLNGVVYYYAWSWTNKEGILMSFDLRNEEFVAVKLPEDAPRLSNLVTFSGKIAFVLSKQDFSSTFELRILEDASKQEWSKVSFVVPSFGDLVGRYRFWFIGELSTGELIFATHSSINPFYYISYDIKENNAKRVVIEGIGDSLAKIDIFLDHVENPTVLSM